MKQDNRLEAMPYAEICVVPTGSCCKLFHRIRRLHEPIVIFEVAVFLRMPIVCPLEPIEAISLSGSVNSSDDRRKVVKIELHALKLGYAQIGDMDNSGISAPAPTIVKGTAGMVASSPLLW